MGCSVGGQVDSDLDQDHKVQKSVLYALILLQYVCFILLLSVTIVIIARFDFCVTHYHHYYSQSLL